MKTEKTLRRATQLCLAPFALCTMLLLTSCLDIVKLAKKVGEQKELEAEAKESAAAKSTWDAFIIGSWKYEDSAGKQSSAYPKGVETFYGDGSYDNHTMDADGNKVILKGTWKLDLKKEHTINLEITRRQTADSDDDDLSETMHYVLLSLEPEESFNYQADGITRKATWVKD